MAKMHSDQSEIKLNVYRECDYDLCTTSKQSVCNLIRYIPKEPTEYSQCIRWLAKHFGQLVDKLVFGVAILPDSFS